LISTFRSYDYDLPKKAQHDLESNPHLEEVPLQRKKIKATTITALILV